MCIRYSRRTDENESRQRRYASPRLLVSAAVPGIAPAGCSSPRLSPGQVATRYARHSVNHPSRFPDAALKGKVDGAVIACDGSSVFTGGGKRDVIVLWERET